MIKFTTFNTKLLLAAIAAVALLGLAALVVTAPGGVFEALSLAPAPQEKPALRFWDAPRALPEAAFTDDAGHQVGLAGYRGKVVLVNFWATWCEPCKEEMPALLRLEKRLGGADFTVLAVSGDRTGKEAVAPYAAANGLAGLTFLYDPMLLAARKMGVKGLPTTLLVGRDGRELGRAEGALDWDSEPVAKRIAAVIGDRESAGR